LLDAITRNAKRLQRLAEDVLDAARIGNKSLKLNKERFNLDEILSNAVKDYRNQNEKVIDSKVKITYVHADISIEADKGRITQVISNLLSNAAKYTTEGSYFALEDPYSLFIFAMNAAQTREKYVTRLDRFFHFINVQGREVQILC